MYFLWIESCQGENCQSSRNFVIPLVISLIALILIIILGIFVIWFYLRRRRNRNEKEILKDSSPQSIDQPPKYYETNDTVTTA
ncbi:unnamed protein product [Adineta steineri]|uniref:Uncharacterized protein n=1 Tax=Adineta steineri TaxID=433720 RepID=A0A814CYL6_9BILA|nr:unnamed protein product [Adineta steineri]